MYNGMDPMEWPPASRTPNDKVADGCGSSLNFQLNLDLIAYAMRPITAEIVNDVQSTIFSRLRASPLLRRKFQLHANIPEVISTRLDRKAPVNKTSDLEKVEWVAWLQRYNE
jgi:hypothetical protein